MRFIRRQKCTSGLFAERSIHDEIKENWKIKIVQRPEDGLLWVSKITDEKLLNIQIVLSKEMIFTFER